MARESQRSAQKQQANLPPAGTNLARRICFSMLLKLVALAALAAAAPRRLGRPPLSSPRSAPPADELSARAAAAGLVVEPLGALGAKVSGVDLSAPLGAATRELLAALWNRHQVLVFRDQRLSEERLLQVARGFGAPKPAGSRGYYMRAGSPHGSGRVSPFPEVSVMSNLDADGRPASVTGGHGSQHVDWHQDDSYTNRPAQGALLYNVMHPVDGGGNTSFCDLYAAYETLPPAVKARLDAGLHLVHDHSRNSVGHVRPGLALPARRADVAGPAHPLVITHPLTGRRALHLGRKQPRPSSYVVEAPGADGDALFDYLWAHATRDEFVWTYSDWRPGDLVVWDNLAVMHARSSVDHTQRREMLRVLLRGPEGGLVGPAGIRTEDSDANCKADASDVAARRGEAAASVVA